MQSEESRSVSSYASLATLRLSLREKKRAVITLWVGTLWGAVFGTWAAWVCYQYSQEGSLWWLFFAMVSLVHYLFAVVEGLTIGIAQDEIDQLRRLIGELEQAHDKL